MTCTFIGDCIALGLSLLSPLCESHAVVGASTAAIRKTTPTGHYEYIVLSAGSNDPSAPYLLQNLKGIRRKVTSPKVVWIAPMNPRAARMVYRAASINGDEVVTFKPSRDGVHPRSYAVLMRAVKSRLD